MNVYDFDGTIFKSNCTVSFALWCMMRHPKLFFMYFPGVFSAWIQNKMGRIPDYKMLRKLFGFLTMIDDFEVQIERYWDRHEREISAWYLAQKKEDDLIISASPACIIAPIAKRLGVNYVATEYDREYGVFLNNLMYAKEKAQYIFDRGFPPIEQFYSDSLSDTPLALCADKAFFVTKRATAVTDWPDLDAPTKQKVKKKINTGWSVHLKE